MRKTFAIFPLALVALAFVVAGCGGSDNNDSSSSSDTTTTESTQPAGGGEDKGGGASTVKLSADPSGALKYDTDKLSTTAGKVTIKFTNDSGTEHDVTIQKPDAQSGDDLAQTDTITSGSASTSVDLPAGTYTYYCSVDGHRQAGMEGTLTVK